MPLIDQWGDHSSYAQYFSSLTITGTDFVVFRDVPELIRQYASGTATLDYGCGAGRSSLFLKSLGLNVEGVDVNETIVNYAKNADPEGEYKVIKSAAVPVMDKHYDLVFSSWVFGAIGSKEELLKVTKEIARVLKTNGTFIGILSNKDTYNTDWLSLNTQFEENKNLKSGSLAKVQFKQNDLTIYSHFWTEEDYREVINEAGLSIIQMHNPLGRDEDGYAWVNEKEKPVGTIYVAKKLS